MTMPARPTSLSAYASGIAAESDARALLEEKNYDIIAQRYKTKAGEIDLIAKRGDHLAFVEVKRRKTHDEAAHAVTPRQQMRIVSAAEVFLSEREDLSQCSMSFDVVLVSSKRSCAHIEQAFLA
jgi:putative endonuclease